MRRYISRAMPLLIAALVGVGASSTVAAANASDDQGIIKTRMQGIQHSVLIDLSFSDGKGVAVGFGGLIAESEDAGKTWKAVDHGKTDLALLAVAKRGAHSIAVGQLGAIMTKSDGEEWQLVEGVTTERLFGVSVNSSGLAVAVGEFGAVWKSNDGGKSWTAARPDWAQYADANTFGTGEPNMYAVTVNDAGVVTIAGEFGALFRSMDGAETWEPVRLIKAKEPTIFSVYIAEEGQGNSYAVGQSGEMLISADGGNNWTRKTFPTDANFLGVTASPNGHVVVTGMRIMVRSQNDGQSWTRIIEDDTVTDWYKGVDTEGQSGRILAAGHSGRIIEIGGS